MGCPFDPVRRTVRLLKATLLPFTDGPGTVTLCHLLTPLPRLLPLTSRGRRLGGPSDTGPPWKGTSPRARCATDGHLAATLPNVLTPLPSLLRPTGLDRTPAADPSKMPRKRRGLDKPRRAPGSLEVTCTDHLCVLRAAHDDVDLDADPILLMHVHMLPDPLAPLADDVCDRMASLVAGHSDLRRVPAE